MKTFRADRRESKGAFEGGRADLYPSDNAQRLRERERRKAQRGETLSIDVVSHFLRPWPRLWAAIAKRNTYQAACMDQKVVGITRVPEQLVKLSKIQCLTRPMDEVSRRARDEYNGNVMCITVVSVKPINLLEGTDSVVRTT